jgi:hypothetical protein
MMRWKQWVVVEMRRLQLLGQSAPALETDPLRQAPLTGVSPCDIHLPLTCCRYRLRASTVKLLLYLTSAAALASWTAVC